jgi:gamma-glutamyltranspeptidase / glutathione hydrolase
VRGVNGAVSAADQIATNAGIVTLQLGGNAVDAGIATNAVMGVVAPHQCGMGGDLFALVHRNGETVALNASGRAGSGADADALRREGHSEMPLHHDIRTVTVPGCVDGWIALHDRFGTMPLGDLLAPAARLAEHGFPASPLLAGSLRRLDDRGSAQLAGLAAGANVGARVVRPGVAATLRAIAEGGRAAFYEGEFGESLIGLGAGLYSVEDLARSQADWVDPLTTTVFGFALHTMPPNSQGYLTLAALRLAEQVGLPDDPDDPEWAHVLIECATAAGFDRPTALHDRADGRALLETIDARTDMIDRHKSSDRHGPGDRGDTTYLCAVDGNGMGVSLIQSNASGLGSWLVEPRTGINLHNRGLGFSLEAGHPAEFAAGRRPPHTLSPALASGEGGDLVAVFGTMGGDAQPQILLQIGARLFHHHESPNRSIRAARWALSGPSTGFDTWTSGAVPIVEIEGHAPEQWLVDLARRGHTVEIVPAYDSGFGHAHAIVVEPDGVLAGMADPRTVVGRCAAI